MASNYLQILNKAQTLSNLILVTPNSSAVYQPQAKPVQNGTAPPNPPAILFHYEGEQTVTLESDITDHYVEDNTAVQDQIALKPETVTTDGFIGELNDVTPPILSILRTAADKLTTISAYTPALSTTATLAYNQAFAAYQTAMNAANAAVSAWKTITGGQTQNKQQEIYSQFYGYWKNRTLFTVQTPWNKFDNMAIKSLRAIQDPETRMITDFQLTFKAIKYAKTISEVAATQGQGRYTSQNFTVSDFGSQSLTSDTSTTFSDNLSRGAIS